MLKQIFALFILCIIASCGSDNEQPVEIEKSPLFRVVPASQSNITFNGQFRNAPIMGGGVAVGDINNDGLQDIFFAGDSTNALYLNKGGLVFEDITLSAGVLGNQWCHGVSMADLNNDGYIDILVTREHNEPHTMFDENFKDTLNVYVYINNGDLTFTDRAIEWGIKTQGPLSHGTLLDVNKDNYLDIYLNANYNSKLKSSTLRGLEAHTVQDFFPDYLFQSDSGKAFRNVIRESGITFTTKHRYGFTPYACDINSDGWVDLYLNNDFDTPDQVYYNNKGKFERAPYNVFLQTSMYTMGIDAADINNDGLIDMFACDMRSELNYRQKTSWWESPYDWTRLLKEKEKELAKQQVKNTLQLNMGNGTFSQISELAGVDATEWSWAPLLADFDNDGWKDIFVSNGNIIDGAFSIDLAYEMDSIHLSNPNFTEEEYLDHIHVNPDNTWFINYMYKNNGDLTFSNVKTDWGFTEAVNTNGAAYADFDNDGDLDIVVNNNGSTSFIYENTLNTLNTTNFLRIQLKSTDNIPMQGARVTIFHGNHLQISELQPVKGLLSSSEHFLHFGLGSATKVDSLLVVWPNGAKEMLYGIEANQLLVITPNATGTNYVQVLANSKPLFNKVTGIGLGYVHIEDDFIDFGLNPLLPNMYSKEGPVMASGDLNGDGLYDLIIGGSVGSTTACYLQKTNGTFKKASLAFTNDLVMEVGAIVIFDADGDGDNDVYIAAGGYEYKAGSDSLLHKFYINNGAGSFSLANKAIPAIKMSSHCVKAFDFDKDGDLDLLVTARLTAQQYPNIPDSYLLQNDGGIFTDVTAKKAPFLNALGMVTDVSLTDFNKDGWTDLVIVGEYMPVPFVSNNSRTLAVFDAVFNDSIKTNGFWNVLKAADFDNDGDDDYVVGNLGLNTRFEAEQEYPLELFAGLFDNNSSVDIICAYYENGNQYPIKQLRTLKPRINGIGNRFFKTAGYGNAVISEVVPPDKLSEAIRLLAYETGSCYIENKGNGVFELTRLPTAAQFAPIQGLLVEDVNGDGNLDVVMTGNFYYAEVERGRYDSFKGLVLLGDGKGNFNPVSLTESGFVVDGDARDLIHIKVGDEELVLASQNSDSLLIYKLIPR